jgi:hypothetical protein
MVVVTVNVAAIMVQNTFLIIINIAIIKRRPPASAETKHRTVISDNEFSPGGTKFTRKGCETTLNCSSVSGLSQRTVRAYFSLSLIKVLSIPLTSSPIWILDQMLRPKYASPNLRRQAIPLNIVFLY